MTGIRRVSQLGTTGESTYVDGSVVLGTDTTGNYVSTVVAGTAISISGATGNVTVTNSGVTALTTSSGLSTNTSATGAVSVTNTGVTSAVAGTGVSVSGATGAVTLSIGQSVATSASPTFSGTLIGTSIYAAWGGVEGNRGYLLLNNIASDSSIYLRTRSDATVYIGGNNQNTLAVTSSSATLTGGMSVTGALNAYSISGNANVAGTGNASYHPSGVYSTGTNWLYGTVYMNGNNIGTNGSSAHGAGRIYASDWYRSWGQTGWYNETYGGGIYMLDTTYVRVYNGKIFLTDYYAGNVMYGNYGSITLKNSAGGYSGIVTPDHSCNIMWYHDIFGHYRDNSNWNFYFNNGSFVASDERWKRNIKPIPYGMDLINALEPVEYQRLTDTTDDPEETVENDISYGFTTQQVFRALAAVGENRDIKMVSVGGPPVLEEQQNDRQYLNSGEMIAPMIKALQELDARIKLLEGGI
jgi:hypothetical protein